MYRYKQHHTVQWFYLDYSNTSKATAVAVQKDFCFKICTVQYSYYVILKQYLFCLQCIHVSLQLDKCGQNRKVLMLEICAMVSTLTGCFKFNATVPQSAIGSVIHQVYTCNGSCASQRGSQFFAHRLQIHRFGRV